MTKSFHNSELEMMFCFHKMAKKSPIVVYIIDIEIEISYNLIFSEVCLQIIYFKEMILFHILF